MHTINGIVNLIEDFKIAHIILPKVTTFVIDDVLHSKKSQRNCLSFKDICNNRYHVKTIKKDNVKYLYSMTIVSNKRSLLENLHAFSCGLY